VVSNVNDVAALQVAAFSDDGFIAWINGQEVARFNMPAGFAPTTGIASPALPRTDSVVDDTLTDARSFLVPVRTFLRFKAFNSSLGNSSDFIINPRSTTLSMQAAPDDVALSHTRRHVRQLTSIEIVFDEAVAGVDAGDLRIKTISPPPTSPS